MSKKKLLLILSILGVIVVCCAAVSGVIIYQIATNQTIQTGLNQAQEGFQGMFELQQKVVETYPADNVEIKLMNGEVLIISLVNSELTALSVDKQEEHAKEVALFAKNNYGAIESIQVIQIVLVQNQNYFAFNYNQSRAYTFKVEELGNGRDIH